MSADPRATAVRYAVKYGCPYLYRCGSVLILVKQVRTDGTSDIEAKQAANVAEAKEFQRRAIRESSWKGNRS